MKKLYILMVAILVTTFSFAQGLEDFTNYAPAGTGYEDGSFVGNDGITWTYVAARISDASNTYGNPTLPSLMLRRVSNGSKITSSTISGGIGDFSVNLYRGYTSTTADRQVELFVNGVSQGVSTGFTDDTEHTFSVTGINIAGDVVIELRSTTSKQTVVDNITWTAYAGAATPSLSISAPTEGEVLPTGDTTVMFNVANFDVGATDGTHDGHIHYTVDGNMTVKYDTNPIVLTGLAPGNHTVYMELVDNNHTAISPAVNTTVNFSVQAYTAVGDIAALRAGTIGDSYELTSEAFINYEQSFRSQKYIQDATAGILIDDMTGKITAGARGDGLSGIKGVLGEYKGMLQFIPVADATVTSPSTITITPQVITLADLTANYEDYEAELVTVENVMIDNTPDVNYVNGTVYPMSSGADTFNFRTSFYGVDYIGTPVHTVAVNVTGLPNEKTGTGASDYGQVLSARDAGDITSTATVLENAITGFAMYPNPTKNELNITTTQNLSKNIQIFDILGKQVVNTNLNGTILNVANLKAGLYIIKVQEAGNTVTRKLVIK